MLFRGPYLKIRTWKQSILQLIQEIRNHVEMYRPVNSSLVTIPAARVVAITQVDQGVAMADADGTYAAVDGITEEAILTGQRGRVRTSGFARLQLLPAEAPTPGMDVGLSTTPGLGTVDNAVIMVGRVYDASSYATDETVIIRLACCATPEDPN
jgi:hypothetical protein